MAISFIIFCLTLIDSVSVFEYSDCIALLLADHLFLKLLLFVKIIITNLLFIFFYAYIFIFRLCFHAIQHIFIILLLSYSHHPIVLSDLISYIYKLFIFVYSLFVS